MNRFYPDPRARSKDGVVAAVEVCNGCPVRGSCRAVSLLRDEHGVWGGTTEADRGRMRDVLAQGAPVGAVLQETVHVVDDGDADDGDADVGEAA